MYSKIDIVEFTTVLEYPVRSAENCSDESRGYVSNNSLENGSWQQPPILFMISQCVFYSAMEFIYLVTHIIITGCAVSKYFS